MSILAIAVITLVFSVIFFAGFTGFIVGDNFRTMTCLVVFAIIPAAAIAMFFSQWLFAPLWIFSYWLGVQVADFLNQREY
jgi:hypothetical protein